MHPVDLLLDRVEELLTAVADDAKVHLYRTKRLTDDQQELPAFVISMGADELLPGASTMDELGMLLNFSVSILDIDGDEVALTKRLLTKRTTVHKTLMAPGALGFGWAIEVGCLGAAEPVTDSTGAKVKTEITTRWQIAYRMNRFDPDIPV